MKKAIKVMLVEDHPEYREILSLALGSTLDIQLMHQFGTAEQALHFLQHNATKSAPDVILLDLNLPGLSGIDAIPWFHEYAPKTSILVLTQSENETDVLQAIQKGATGYFLKASTRNQLIDGIRLVMEGGSPIDSKVATFILKKLRSSPQKTDTEGLLSDREIEVLTQLSKGLVKKEIADQLDISAHTVSNHIRHIYEKLQVQNAPAAISKAYQKGILGSRPI